jgi:hypothetical protein
MRFDDCWFIPGGINPLLKVEATGLPITPPGEGLGPGFYRLVAGRSTVLEISPLPPCRGGRSWGVSLIGQSSMIFGSMARGYS